MRSRTIQLCIAAGVLLFSAADQPKQSGSRATDKQALSALQDYVGAWRGVGQPRRGSTEGAWIEQSEWAWQFSDDRATIRFTAPKSKYLTAGTLRAVEADKYQLTAKTAENEKELKYTGAIDESGKLVLIADELSDEHPSRISIRLVADGKRLVTLLERKSQFSDNYVRLAEVGYTREGSGFGQGLSVVECVVTGGKGTIAVMHEGKTYYVCCTGCRDLFNEDPAAVLAEYAQRKEADAGKKK